MNQLLGQWDARLAAETFDPDSLKYSFFSTIEQDLAGLARRHGTCRMAGPLVAPSPTQARWRVACERGAIRFKLWLSPAPNPQVQLVRWEDETPPNEKPSAGSSGTDPKPAPERAPDSPCQE